MTKSKKSPVSFQSTDLHDDIIEKIMEQRGVTKSEAIRIAIQMSAPGQVAHIEEAMYGGLLAIEEASKPAKWSDLAKMTQLTSDFLRGTTAEPTEPLSTYRMLRFNSHFVSGSIDFYREFVAGKGFDIVLPKHVKASEKVREAVLKETHRLLYDVLEFPRLIPEYTDIFVTEGFCPVEILKKDGLVYGWNFIGTDGFTVHHEEGKITPTKYSIKNALGNVIPFKVEDVMKLEPNKKPNEFFGLSYIKPVLTITDWLLKIQEAYVTGVYRYGNPILIFVAKDWGEPQIRNFMQRLKKRAEKGSGSLVITGDVDVKEIRPTQAMMSRRDALDHLVEMFALGIGIPQVLYNVESISQEAANIQWQVFLDRIDNIREHINSQVRKFILKPHLEAAFADEKFTKKDVDFDKNGNPIIPIPEIVWQNLKTARTDKRLESLVWLMRVEYSSPLFRKAVELQLADILDLDLEEAKKHMDDYMNAIPPTLPKAQTTDKEENVENEGNTP